MAIIRLLMALTFIVSCGPGQLVNKKKKVYGERSLGIPLSLIHSQKKCSDQSQAQFHQLSLLSRGEKTDYEVDFSQQSHFVEKNEYAGEFHGKQQLLLLMLPQVVKAPKALKICPVEQNYEPNSYQDAALSILAPIKNFEKKYAQTVEALKLEPVKIRTAPLMKLGNQYLINNAFYYSGTNEITFLPQGYDSEEDKTLPFNGIPFWRFPMVSLHEYGHHIFTQLLKRARSLENLPPSENKVQLCFDNGDELHGVQKDSDSDKRSVDTPMLAIGAINEAFADIFAYYSDESGRGLDKMGCMSRSRDVESFYFLNLQRKRLTPEGLSDFLNEEVVEYTGCGSDVDFQDIHIVGAVFARAIYRALVYKPLTDEQKIKIIIDGVKRFTSQVGDLSDNKEVLELAAHSFYDAIMQEYKLNSVECETYFKHFPALEVRTCL